MRKLTSIVLIVCLSYTWLAYHLVFHVQLMAAKSEMKAFLRSQKDHKDIIQFRFNEEELKNLEWEDENEFRYHGVMYDVVERKTEGTQLILRVIADKKEMALLHSYQKNTNQNRSNSLRQLITAQFVLPGDHQLNRPEKNIHKFFTHRSSALLDHAMAVLPPPPDAAPFF